jgi:hypothetical protein
MYYIEQQTSLGWRKVPFAEHKNRCYCDGYVDACDSIYPSDPLRIVKQDKEKLKVVRETKGRGKVHLN